MNAIFRFLGDSTSALALIGLLVLAVCMSSLTVVAACFVSQWDPHALKLLRALTVLLQRKGLSAVWLTFVLVALPFLIVLGLNPRTAGRARQILRILGRQGGRSTRTRKEPSTPLRSTSGSEAA